ncbi:hypothetical protein Plav_1513 [Parvibaculum lavamentivorans DS-1]|uniref:N-acetyltransferase domain-containing protein n=1 Tax=Parvibaculum lavamentivorans (strain DS-1 / DSM 13023 / NCIMB 13966) TaxID=402881 RepID=A7HT99_PARL1|nr:hypothetical protein [Parvibaculum lavamentivorans]ABS63132.1 hypothetical protein Plav_1513 [Parvibaculum lavamentivorans DS-1]
MNNIRYAPGWKKNDTALEAAAAALWHEYGALPHGVTPEARAKEICCAAFDGDRMIGVSTIDIRPYPPLRNKRFGFLRVFTRPDYEQQDVAIGLASRCRDLLEEWSIAHPQAGLAGMAAIYQSPKLGHYPIGESGLTLIGYTPEGFQVRVVWFNHLPLTEGYPVRLHAENEQSKTGKKAV